MGSLSSFFRADSSSPKSKARFEDALSVSAMALLPRPKPLTLPLDLGRADTDAVGALAGSVRSL